MKIETATGETNAMCETTDICVWYFDLGKMQIEDKQNKWNLVEKCVQDDDYGDFIEPIMLFSWQLKPASVTCTMTWKEVKKGDKLRKQNLHTVLPSIALPNVGFQWMQIVC